MANFLHAFDLNVRLEDDDDGDVVFDLNDPPLEHDNGITCSSLVHFLPCYLFLSIVSHIKRTIVTGFDLNLPLDEFGAVDFNYLQNLDGTLFFPYYLKYAHAVAITIMHMP